MMIEPVRYIYRGDNQLDRAPIDEVIEVLKEGSKEIWK